MENTLRIPLFTYILIAMNVAVFIIMELTGNSTTNTYDLLDWGANFIPFTFKYEWWRLISSAFLHIGIWHLIINMYSLYVIGRDLEVHVGSTFFLIIYILSALFAGLFSGYFNLYVVSAGASGAIFGLYGFDFVQIIVRHRGDLQRVKRVAINFVIYLIIITTIGTQANFDNAGHYGGLTAGVLLSIVFISQGAVISKFRLITIGVIGSFLVFTFYTVMPRSKVEYFDAFQTFIKTDELTNQHINGDHSSDSVMVDQLIASSALWDTLGWRLDSIVDLPEELSSDTIILKQYLRLKQDEISHVVKSIREESFIYYDSIREVRNLISSLPTLSYPLNFSRPIEPIDTSSNKSSDLTAVTTNYDSLWRETSASNFEYYRRGYKDSLGRWEGFVSDYYKNGLTQMRGRYTRDLKDGVFLYYNDNNTYSAAGRYVKDRKVGKWQYFYETGQMKSEVRYVDWAYMLNTWDSVGNKMVDQGALIAPDLISFLETPLSYQPFHFSDSGKPLLLE